MNYELIIVAVISLVGTLAGSYFSAAKTTSLIILRIEQLEKKVETLNQIVERIYKLEKDMNTAFMRIDELREDINELKGELK